MAEWNRRREAADSDSEAVEQVADQRRPLNRLADAGSEVTGWNANEVMRQLRDMLFPVDHTKSAESNIEKYKKQEEWTLGEPYNLVRRDEAELNSLNLVEELEAIKLNGEYIDMSLDPHFDGESIQLLENNCAPTATANMIRDTFGVLPDGGQYGVTERARESGAWWEGNQKDDDGGVKQKNMGRLVRDELARLGIEAEVQSVLVRDDVDQADLIAALNSGAGILAGTPGHEVQIVSATPDSVTILDPWLGRRISMKAEHWHQIVEDYEIIRPKEG